jgi:hypothetical protein
MEHYFINASVIAVVYAVLKFIDIRYISKTPKNVKEISRELFVVYASAVSGLYVIDNVNPSEIKKTTAAFVEKPPF